MIKYNKFVGHTNEEERDINRAMLSEDVKFLRCLNLTSFAESNIPQDVKDVLSSRICPDETLGSIEEYEGGIYNVFVRIMEHNAIKSVDGFFRVIP